MKPGVRDPNGPVSRPAKRLPLFLAAGLAVWVLTMTYLRATDSDLTYLLQGPESGVSATGINPFCLPYTRKSGLNTASDLLNDIEVYGGTGSVNSISRFVRSGDSLKSYAGGSADLPNNFNLNDGKGYLVQVTSSFNYQIEGDHDLNQTVKFYKLGASIGEPSGEGNSYSGTADYCPPYYAADTWTANDLRDEINAVTEFSVNNIWRRVRSNDSLQA